MNKEKMERLREDINKMITLDDCDQNELLEKSQELDKLILQSIKENNYAKKKFGYKLKSELDAIIKKIQLSKNI